MLKGGGHVSIGGVQYLLNEQPDGSHYVHNIPGLFSHEERVEGDSPKLQPRVERLVWSMSDWVNGEGNRVFYQNDEATYDYAVGINTRIPGQFTVRPKRDHQSADITTGDVTAPIRLTGAIGQLWYAGGTNVGVGDGDNAWTNKDPTLPASHLITAIAGDHERLYLTSWKGGGGAANDRLMFWTADGSTYRNLLVSETINGTDTAESSKHGYFGLALHNGRLFAWTGSKLFSYDVFNLSTDSSTTTLSSDQYRKVYDSGDDVTKKVTTNQFWADIVNCGQSVVFFAATPGRSVLYQYKQGVARPIWECPVGFTVKSIAHANGVIFACGTFSAGTSGGTPGHGVLYALPLDNMRPIRLKWVRKTVDTNLQMQVASSSFGDQILVCAAHTGRIFVYDAEYNGFSMLDDLGGNDSTNQETAKEAGTATLTFVNNAERIGDIISWGKYRVAAIYSPSGAATRYQTLHYYNDEPGQRQTTATNMNWFINSPEHDFEYPDQQKVLLGFHVQFQVEDTNTTSGLLANQQIRIQYALDKGQSPSWTTAATITSATTPSGTLGRVFVDLTSSTKRFFRLRWRAIVDNNNTAGVKPPIVLGVTAEAELSAYEETFDLELRIKDMTAQTRVSSKSPKANIQRDTLIAARKARNIVDFVDGYIYREFGRTASSQKVFIDSVKDSISRNGEGVMKVRLRVVPV